MGARGPAPARSDQRRRRNKPEKPIEKVELEGDVVIPEPGEWHATAVDWYRSLKDSGQSRYFEPSDWQAAHFCAALMHECLSGPVNAQLVGQVRAMMADLLTTEGARRRAGVEIERAQAESKPKPKSGTVTRMDDRRKRLTDAS